MFRKADDAGRYRGDIIGLRDEAVENGRPLLEPVMVGGKVIKPHPTLPAIRERFAGGFACLPEKHKAVDREAPPYPVALSRGLRDLQLRV